jgi:DNA polymerase-3 subunit gamma/tau
MSYLSLYRKYRPQRFEDVVGQEPVVRTLQNALQRGRVAHAYLFSGPRGTGKTSLARLLAKGLNCSQGPTPNPCNFCSNCQRISDGFAMDVVEIDGASNRGIDEIRDLRENVRFAPTEGGHKVYIIDEVHMLTTDAFNALLKTLEEPPERVVFVLATTEPHKVPETIASRCQRFEFRNFTTEQLVMRLRQVVEAEELDVTRAALELIGRHAAGGMRDAIALLDQAISFQTGRIEEGHIAELLGVVPGEQLCELLNSIAGEERLAALTLLHQMIGSGVDPAQLGKDCIGFLRELMVAKVGSRTYLTTDGEDLVGRWPALASLELERILTLIDLLARAVADMRWMSPVWLPLEMAVVRGTGDNLMEDTKSANMRGDATWLQELTQRVAYLEAAIKELKAIGTPWDNRLSPVIDETRPDHGSSHEWAASESGGGLEDQVSTSASSSREAEFDSLLSQWGEVSEILRQERQAPVEAFLREAIPQGFDSDGRLLLAFPRAKEFHKVSLEQPKNREALERVLAPIVGRAIEVVCLFEDDIPQRKILTKVESMEAKTGAAGPEPEASGSTPEEEVLAPGLKGADRSTEGEQVDLGAGNPALEAALKIFGGTVVELKDDTGEGSKQQ